MNEQRTRELSAGDSQFLHVDGLRVHVRVLRGPATRSFVLVHGLGVSGRYLMPLALQLQRHGSVYVPDLPGFGLTDDPTWEPDIATLANALTAVVSSLGCHRPVFFANSVGCQVVASAVSLDPSIASALVLSGPTVDRRGRSGLVMFARWCADTWHEPSSLIPLLLRDLRDTTPRRMLSLLRDAIDTPLEASLPHVRVPTLVLTGELDRVSPVAWGRYVTSRIPLAEWRQLAGTPHDANFANPAATAKEIEDFLSRHDS